MVQVNALASVVVLAPLLITRGPNVVLLPGVIVPVPTMLAVKLVNVPPVLRVKPSRFNDVTPITNAVVPKFSVPK